MQELTREQEAAIARLAIDHPSVAVAPQGDGIVKVEAGGKGYFLDEDGHAVPEPVERAYMALPIDLLRRLLGDVAIDAALAEVEGASYPDHALGRRLNDAVAEEIRNSLDMLDLHRGMGVGAPRAR